MKRGSALNGNATIASFVAAIYAIAISGGIYAFWTFLMRRAPQVRDHRRHDVGARDGDAKKARFSMFKSDELLAVQGSPPKRDAPSRRHFALGRGAILELASPTPVSS